MGSGRTLGRVSPVEAPNTFPAGFIVSAQPMGNANMFLFLVDVPTGRLRKAQTSEELF